MFGIELGEMFTLGVVALLIFGPERLPEVALKAAQFLRKMRSAADSARSELSTSLGPEFQDLDLRELNPRTFVRRHVLDPADDDGVLRGLKSNGAANGRTAAAANGSTAARGSGATRVPLAKESGPALPPAMAAPLLAAGERPPFDDEAT